MATVYLNCFESDYVTCFATVFLLCSHPFVVGMSSRAMLSVIEQAAVSRLPTVFHMDCTFKCNDNEFPVLVLGVTDAQQQFHPLSISVISHRNTDIYLKCLDAFKTIVTHVVPSTVSFVPKYGMTDCEPAER